MRRLPPLLAVLLLSAGCQSPAAPIAPKVVAPPAEAPRTGALPDTPPTPSELEKQVAYTKDHPWGDDTGGARLRGTATWGQAGAPGGPLAGRALVLKGLKGTPSDGLYYRVLTNASGEFAFDRIRGGDFKLSDDIAPDFHWRLRVAVTDERDTTIDLTPQNGTSLRDDFPPRRP